MNIFECGHKHRVFAVVLSVLFSIAPFANSTVTAFQFANPPEIKSSSQAMLVRELLDSRWSREGTNELDSRKSYSSSNSPTPVEMLAFVLNRMQHNKSREAIKVAGQLTRRYPTSVDGWMIRAWLSALINDYERSLIDMRSLKQQLTNQPKLTQPQKEIIYQRMGKLVGYLQGPVGDKVNQDILKSTIIFIAAGLPAQTMEEFNKSREDVLTRFEDLAKAQNISVQDQLARQQITDEQTERTLTNQSQILNQSLQQIASEIELVRSEGNQQLSNLDAQRLPLENQLTTLSSQISQASYDLQLLYTDLYYAQQVPPIHRTSIFFLSDQIRRRELELYTMEADAAAISDQLQLLQSQIARTQLTFEARLRNLDRDYAKLNNSNKRTQIKLAKIASGPSIADGKREALTSRLTALTSYDPFPVELYRQQLLDLLPNK